VIKVKLPAEEESQILRFDPRFALLPTETTYTFLVTNRCYSHLNSFGTVMIWNVFSKLAGREQETQARGAVNDDEKTRLEFWKIEYEKGAERYENIYKALWQNFQYLALVSAAILTFGKDSLPAGMIMLLAGLPVLFWFVAQYIPMDRYGVAARDRLAEIEHEFNDYFAKNSANSKIIPEFRHYTEFSKNFKGTHRKKGLFWSTWRVRTAVKYSALVMFVVWVILVVCAFRHPTYFAGEKKSAASELAEIRQDLKTLKRTLSPRAVAPKP